MEESLLMVHVSFLGDCFLSVWGSVQSPWALVRLTIRARCVLGDVLLTAGKAARTEIDTCADVLLNTFAVGVLEHSSVRRSRVL